MCPFNVKFGYHGLADVVFTNMQNCQYWHNGQICIPTYLQFSFLFASYCASKFEKRYQ